MLSPHAFRELISGRRRGASATILRGLLRAAEVPCTAAVHWRNARYDCGRATSHRVEVPVICVGNITLGGTGKTPVVAWLANWLQERKVRVVLVSRGYKSSGTGRNDEALELARKLPGAAHVQNPDRVAAAREAIDRHGAELIVLDDGFQHRRLARELDIVLLDALDPFGFGHVFPRGTLREPLAGLARAHILGLTRADQISASERAELRRRLTSFAPDAAWCELVHRPTMLVSPSGVSRPVASLRGQAVVGFCGIGNPAGFERTLSDCGMRLLGLRCFPDHYRYRPEDLQQLALWSHRQGAAAVVCTEKDLVKLEPPMPEEFHLWALRIEAAFAAGREHLEAALQSLLPGTAQKAA